MKSSHRSTTVLLPALLAFLAGCAGVPTPVVQRGADPLAGQPVISREATTDAPVADAAETTSPAVSAVLTPGTGTVINERVAATPPPSLDMPGEATFNFEGEPVHAVVKVILGDLLQQNYVIAPGVQGQVTLATPRPVNAAQALGLLEMVLGWNNARLVWLDGRYNVLPTEQALAGNLSPRTGGVANARGYEVRAVPLRYISASEMKKLLEPYARPNAVVSTDASRNLIVLAGTRAELQNYLRTVEIFDVDWLAGMSVGVYPLMSSEAEAVVSDLEAVFGADGNTPVAGMFRFMPLRGQNAVLVITPQPRYLREVQAWIERLDAGGGEGARLYTYEVLYMKAVDLAEQLNLVFGGAAAVGPSTATGGPPSLMPGLEPVQLRSINTPATDAADPKARAAAVDRASAATGASAGAGVSVGSTEGVSVSAVEESNALLVRATPGQWESIRRTIERLDTMPLQVHIEAQVVEVQLNGRLSYGVNWFFENAVADEGLPAAAGRTIWGDLAGSVGEDGLSWTFLGRNAAAVISALDRYSDVRVLSTPSVVVRNNAEAKLDVGTKIPVNSTSFNPIDGGGGTGTFTQVQYLDTGVILTVTPRISRDGTVFMEIEQEVSSPGDSPDANGNLAINKRKLTTEAAVQSGETVMLAGLISDSTLDGSDGLPGLSRLPVVGGLFGRKTQDKLRTEVIILVTPRVVRDPNEARRLTDEYGERFRALEPLRRGNDGR
ncbi:MAG: type II secretion system protein GspD [Arenimonas sp. SCN 70-307]|uniref:type II secretion system secretin GspD n=1 Tax=Arenimonas sp. SCN 70-307 TaxID=1660089 RepID=UPI00086B0834|nr:type II secretion system secretin GspD [Arenimonas sp. SCN 70-307]ODS63131.1 MAG: type II secretion system protein GspD [Arenimonas sp. SCN 70-307]